MRTDFTVPEQSRQQFEDLADILYCELRSRLIPVFESGFGFDPDLADEAAVGTISRFIGYAAAKAYIGDLGPLQNWREYLPLIMKRMAPQSAIDIERRLRRQRELFVAIKADGDDSPALQLPSPGLDPYSAALAEYCKSRLPFFWEEMENSERGTLRSAINAMRSAARRLGYHSAIEEFTELKHFLFSRKSRRELARETDWCKGKTGETRDVALWRLRKKLQHAWCAAEREAFDPEERRAACIVFGV